VGRSKRDLRREREIMKWKGRGSSLVELRIKTHKTLASLLAPKKE
jgi:hypothetical protein